MEEPQRNPAAIGENRMYVKENLADSVRINERRELDGVTREKGKDGPTPTHTEERQQHRAQKSI